MITNLQELKNSQDTLRANLLGLYQSVGKSILSVSKDIQIPYTSLRSFMMGKRLSYMNLLKIENWLKNYKKPVTKY